MTFRAQIEQQLKSMMEAMTDWEQRWGTSADYQALRSRVDTLEQLMKKQK